MKIIENAGYLGGCGSKNCSGIFASIRSTRALWPQAGTPA
jgi:hypothetical protein